MFDLISMILPPHQLLTRVDATVLKSIKFVFPWLHDHMLLQEEAICREIYSPCLA
jgi:hypothetical protein